MVNTHSKATGDSLRATGIQQPDNTVNIDHTDVNTGNVVQSNTPANQQAIGEINFLGSSYSGADIKVFANIYNDTMSRDSYTEELQNQKDVADAIATGCQNVISANSNGRLTSGSSSWDWLQQIGFQFRTDAEMEAARFLIQNFYSRIKSGLTSSQLSALAAQAASLQETYRATSTSLQEQISALRTDTVATGSYFFLGTLQTISVQSHREKFGVRSLGRSYVKGYTRGPRTIAGSMIFTVFHEHAFAGLMRKIAQIEDPEISSLIPDQLPPIDLTIAFANEYGQQSVFRLYGVEILNDGVTYSIEDLLSENVMQFVCRDLDPLTNSNKVLTDRQARNATSSKENTSASSLYSMNNDYTAYLERLHVRRRLLGR